MEYEGFGCPEVKRCQSEIDQIKKMDLCTEFGINKEFERWVGITNQKLSVKAKYRQKDLDVANSKNLYSILEESIHKLWDDMETELSEIKDKQKILKSIEGSGNYQLSKKDDKHIKDIVYDLIEQGYLTSVIEYYILELIIARQVGGKEKYEYHAESLIKLLVDSQEYCLCESIAKRIKIKELNLMSQSLYNYIKTIMSRSSFDSFMLMNSLKLLEKKSFADELEEYFFLINNQSAFCKAINGDFENALEHEIEIISTTRNLFYQHIACVNAARILLKMNKKDAIYPIIRGLYVINQCKYKQAYQIIYMTYLERWSKLFEDDLKPFSVNWEAVFDHSNYGKNWRVLQALKRFKQYTNYQLEDVWCQSSRDTAKKASLSKLNMNTDHDWFELKTLTFLQIFSCKYDNQYKGEIEVDILNKNLSFNVELEGFKIVLK